MKDIFGVEISLEFDTNENMIYRFIDEAIELNDCLFGGGSTPNSITGMIELGDTEKLSIKRLNKIKKWATTNNLKIATIGKIHSLRE